MFNKYDLSSRDIYLGPNFLGMKTRQFLALLLRWESLAPERLNDLLEGIWIVGGKCSQTIDS